MLITQTAGRAGRHGARGAVIVQTYNPEHYAVRTAMRQDCTIIGPSPALIERERGVYRFIVLIKTGVLASVQEFLREQGVHLRDDIAIDIDPIAIF